MHARQDTGEAPFKESLSAFHAAAGTGGETTVTLNGKEYSSSKSDKSRKRKADEKKGSRKDPRKREKGKILNPKTAKQYRIELEREIRQAEAEDLSIKQEGNVRSTALCYFRQPLNFWKTPFREKYCIKGQAPRALHANTASIRN